MKDFHFEWFKFPALEKKSSILFAFGAEEIIMLLSKNKVANEMRLVQGGKFELCIQRYEDFIMDV